MLEFIKLHIPVSYNLLFYQASGSSTWKLGVFSYFPLFKSELYVAWRKEKQFLFSYFKWFWEKVVSQVWDVWEWKRVQAEIYCNFWFVFLVTP